MYRMGVLDTIHKSVSRMRGMVGKEIHQLTPAERRVIRWLRDEGFYG